MGRNGREGPEAFDGRGRDALTVRKRGGAERCGKTAVREDTQSGGGLTGLRRRFKRAGAREQCPPGGVPGCKGKRKDTAAPSLAVSHVPVPQ